jgi:hypothetical protein
LDEPGSEVEGQDKNPDPAITRELFLQWRSPRAGRVNPERLNNPVWEWLIRTRLHAYTANEKFGGPDSLGAGPCWCFSRYGQSATLLPDGRKVLVGGEHEDHYDADFCIYNDVVVLHPDGRIDIFGYPKEVFPPTDSHTATLVGQQLIIIGNLGYREQRKPGITPIFMLDLETFSMSRATARGDQPGWLHKHTAELSDDLSILVQHGQIYRGAGTTSLVENVDDWRLHLSDWRWERLTERGWQQWEIRRKDGKQNQLWKIRLALWTREAGWEKESAGHLETLARELGARPNLDIVPALYRPGIPHQEVTSGEKEHRTFRIQVDGVVVRYVEDMFSIQISVEGELAQEAVEVLTSDLVEKLTKLENTLYEAEQL